MINELNKDRKPCGLHCIKIHHFHVNYGSEVILDDINMHIHCGKLYVLIGKNGGGKSTLVKAILDEVPHEGKIVLQTPEGRSLKKKNPLRIGYPTPDSPRLRSEKERSPIGDDCPHS